jgi:hypothetical protein
VAYFRDLSDYVYSSSASDVEPAKNVGWLDAGFDFAVAAPTEQLLSCLWQFCLVSIQPTRGLHQCPFCAPPPGSVTERNGVKVLLGSAEIRVFAPSGNPAFAAPNLIYHYVSVHHYLPPDPFLEALQAGPSPTDSEYSEMLSNAQLRWSRTPPLDEEPVAMRPVKRGDEVVWEKISKD